MKSYLSSRFQAITRKTREIVAIVCLAAMVPVAAGCFGSFKLTTAVYNVNAGVSDNGVIQSIVMWIFAILPVYGIAIFADVIIFNTIEFLSGESVDLASVTTEDGTTITFAPSEENADTATLTAVRDGEVISEHKLVRSEEEVAIYTMDGALVARAGI